MAEHTCNKEDKLDSMEKDIGSLKRVVLPSNGNKGLVGLHNETQQALKHLTGEVELTSSNVSQLIKFQNQVETARSIKEDMRDRRRLRTRWVVGITITVLLGTGSILAIILT